MQRFMHYVSKTRRADEQRERSLEALINEQVENQWERKDSRKKLEKDARKALMQDVMATREKQRQERGKSLHESAFKKMQFRKRTATLCCIILQLIFQEYFIIIFIIHLSNYLIDLLIYNPFIHSRGDIPSRTTNSD